MGMMRQVHLRWKSESQTVEHTCWVEDHPKLKVGNSITLKDENDGKLWEILSMSDHCVEKKSLYKPWHVGGL